MTTEKAPAGSPLDGAASDVRVNVDDGEGWFTAAYVESADWNGWACPWFSEAEAERIAVTTAAWAKDSDDAEVIQHHPDAPPPSRFTCRSSEGDVYPIDALPDPAHPGAFVYRIGARNWTWRRTG